VASGDRLVVPALLAVSFSFATMAIAGKIALTGLPPLALAGVRVASAAVVLLAAAWFVARERVPRADLARMAGLAFLGVTVNQVLFIQGLSLTGAIPATVLVATIPAFTLLVAGVLGHEKLTARRGFGVAVSFTGVVVLLGASAVGGLGTSLLGDALILVNALSYSFYLVLSRPVLARYSPVTVVGVTFGFGALFTLAVSAPSLATVDWAALPRDVVLATGWVVLVSTILAYGLNNWVLRRAPASTVASYVYLQPLIAAALAIPLFGEALTPGILAGGALILGGVALVTRDGRPKAAPLPAAPE